MTTTRHGDETIHTLSRLPIHLYQLNAAEDAYSNRMGCGAFTTAMALSAYDPGKYGTYDVARFFFDRMLKVPIFGGTFESQNARIARLQGFMAHSYSGGTLRDLTAAVDAGAPTIMLIDPRHLGVGSHDVLLVGYSADGTGTPRSFFVDNPARPEALQPGTPYPGNQTMPAAELTSRWTRVFTPIFSDDQQQAAWLGATGRQGPPSGLFGLFS